MSSITQEKNNIYFFIGEKTTPYTFDINTAIFYGLSGKPIKTVPSGIHECIREYRDDILTVRYIGQLLYDRKVKFDNFINYQNTFAVLDRLNSIGYHNDIGYNGDENVAFVGRHFKKFCQAFNEDNNLTIYEFCYRYKENEWRKKYNLVSNEHITNDMISVLYDHRSNFNENEMNHIIKYVSKGLLDFYDFGTENYNYYGEDNIFRKLKRYFNRCEWCNIEPTKDNFFRHYIEVSRTYNMRKQEIDDNTIIEHYKRLPQLNYENDNFKVIIPQSTTDFLDEANNQRNCVYSIYLKQVLNGQTNVVFIRKKESLDKSYITCEVDNRGRIIQYLAKCNSRVTDTDALNFQAEYRNYLINNWK